MRRRFICVIMALALVVSGSVYWQLKLTGAALTGSASSAAEADSDADEDGVAADAGDSGTNADTDNSGTNTGADGDSTDTDAEAADTGSDSAGAENCTAYVAEDEDSGVTVTVTAPEGALPEGAELSVTLYEESGEEYAAAAETTGFDTEDEESGMAAMDISFYVDGEEAEPVEAVTVSIDASAILPEDADASTIEVRHLTETEDGVEAELVADATEDTDGTVDSETAVAEFTVESFSEFTLTWYTYEGKGTKYGAQITVNVYTSTDGSTYSLASGDSLSYSLSSNTSNSLTLTISDLVDEVTGLSGYSYTYATVTYGSDTYGSSSDSVTSVTASHSSSGSGPDQNHSYSSTIYTATNTNGTTGPSASKKGDGNISYFTINLYYSVANGVSITDNIAADGTFVATLVVDGAEVTGDDLANYTFTWYKSGAEDVDGDYTEVTDTSVLSSYNSAIYVALDQGGLYYYKVVVTDANGTEVGTATMQVPYATELLNGSFEEPETTSTSQTFGESSVPYWQTTASTGNIEIGQYVASDATYGSSYHYAGGSQSVAGDQFAELNADAAGSLYQDVLTAGGVELNWSLYHRARTADGGSAYSTSKTDTMYVVIMSAEDAQKVLDYAESNNLDQQTVLTTMIQYVLQYGTSLSDTNAAESATGDYTLPNGETVTVNVWTLTTTNYYTDEDWTYYYGSYTVPEGQYLTRFFFVSGETGSGYTTVGNLIDNVKFTQKLTYTIEYWVWDDSKGEYVLETASTETGEVNPYTNVSESYLSTTYAQYALVGSVTGTASGGSDPTLDTNTVTQIKVSSTTTYLSLYLKKSGVTVVKKIEGLTDDALEELDTYTYTVEFPITNNSTGDTDTYSVTVGESGSSSIYIEGLAAGTYTIKEADYATTLILSDGTYVWTGVSVSATGANAVSTDGEYTFTLTSGSAVTITYTNTYELKTTSVTDVTLKKVDHDDPDTTLSGAEFTLYDGTDTTTITVDETLALTDLSYDTEYTLTETVAPDGYNLLTEPVKFTISSTDGTVTFTSGSSHATYETDGSGNITIIVDNVGGYELPSTGGAGRRMYLLTGLLICLGAFCFGAVFRLRRRRVSGFPE